MDASSSAREHYEEGVGKKTCQSRTISSVRARLPPRGESRASNTSVTVADSPRPPKSTSSIRSCNLIGLLMQYENATSSIVACICSNVNVGAATCIAHAFLLARVLPGGGCLETVCFNLDDAGKQLLAG